MPEGVKFMLMVNKQGHTRFSKWMQHIEDDPHRRRMMEYELVRKCMPRDVDHVRLLLGVLIMRGACVSQCGNYTVRCDLAGQLYPA